MAIKKAFRGKPVIGVLAGKVAAPGGPNLRGDKETPKDKKMPGDLMEDMNKNRMRVMGNIVKRRMRAGM